jgi:hypothetical protein
VRLFQAIILNLGISDSFQPINWRELKFPAEMLVDYVRVCLLLSFLQPPIPGELMNPFSSQVYQLENEKVRTSRLFTPVSSEPALAFP